MEALETIESQKILLIDSANTFQHSFSEKITAGGFQIDICINPTEGIGKALAFNYDAVVINSDIEEICNNQVCAMLKQAKPYQPLIFTISHDSEQERIKAFNLGANDVISPTIGILELKVRILSALKRLQPGKNGTNPNALHAGNLTIDVDSRTLSRDGEKITLTATEFDLLYFLVSNPGRVYSREQLLKHVWDCQYQGENTVNVHINRLRAKIEEIPSKPRCILTVWGVGYKFADS